jgi:thioredoxin-like negative regulator of GroEL|tara:strand:- start:322 stop:570 length:249 start_codon:yes stop_codon:yes gene_type:complete
MKQLLYFTAAWCGPCKKFRPLMENLSSQINVQFIDIDSNPGIAQNYGVRNIPTTILVKDGVEVSRFTGSKPAQQILESYYNG